MELCEPEDYDAKYEKWNMADLPICPTEWKMEVKKDAKEQFKNIKELLKSATLVINCGDPDREGQLLVDELLIHLKVKKPTKRLLILDPKNAAIQKAIDNMEDNSRYYSWYQAGLLRSQADWLIGMNFTRAFTNLSRKMGGVGVTSAGRVQTPTLKLLYDRDLAITNFKPLSYYNLFATFKSQANQLFTAKLDFTGLNVTLDADGRLLEDKSLVAICTRITNKVGQISQYETRDCETSPPLTFKLSDLQAVANAKLGFSADETLATAQKLYEKQLTTYPRSACSYLPESLHSDAENILKNLAEVFINGETLKADPAIKSRVFNDKQLGGESHFAITPTGDMSNIGALSDQEMALYKLIAVQYLAQFYPNMKYEQTTGTVLCETLNFKFSGRVTKSLGWKSLFTSQADEESDKAPDDQDEEQVLPPLSLNELANHCANDIKCTTTKKLKPYTEGSLIKAMANIHNELENIVKSYYTDPVKVKEMVERYRKVLKDTAGLGTEATRSNIITTLKTRNFIELKGKNIQVTNKGKTFMQLLTSPQNIMHFSMLTSPLTTAMYEQQLEGILNKTFTAEQFNVNLHQLIIDKISIVKAQIESIPSKAKLPTIIVADEKCPKCNADIVERTSKFGKFRSCTKYPKCTWSSLKDKVGQIKKYELVTLNPWDVYSKLRKIIFHAYPDKQIPSFKLNIHSKDLKSKHGSWHYRPLDKNPFTINIYNLYRKYEHTLSTVIHEVAHHCQFALTGVTNHKKEFYQTLHHLMLIAHNVGIINLLETYDEIDSSDKNRLKQYVGGFDIVENQKANIDVIKLNNENPQDEKLKNKGYVYSIKEFKWVLLTKSPLQEIDWLESNYPDVRYDVYNYQVNTVEPIYFCIIGNFHAIHPDKLTENGFYYCQINGWVKKFIASTKESMAEYCNYNNVKPKFKGFTPKTNRLANAHTNVPVLGNITKDKCPNCGSSLITNSGVQGGFISCSKFLFGCRYMKNRNN